MPGVHQACSDMFLLSEWNKTKTFNIPLERDFGTDYGMCCWYTPQINITEVNMNTKEQGLSEPDWGLWFANIRKVWIVIPTPVYNNLM